MKIKKTLLLSFLVLLASEAKSEHSGATQPASLETQPLSFMDAWQVLQANNNSLSAERANVERYQYLQQATDSLNYPKITLGANYTRLDDDVTLSGREFAKNTKFPSSLPAPYASVVQNLADILHLGDIETKISNQDVVTSSIRMIWPIFTGWKISAAQSGAEGQKLVADSQMKMETQARFEDLSRYYFSVLLAKNVYNTQKEVVAGLRQHQHNAEKLEQQGQIAHVEKLQADASLKKAEVDLNKAQKTLEIAQSALTQVLNTGQEIVPDGVLFVNERLPKFSAFLDMTLSTYPGLSLLDAKEKQAASLIEAEKSSYYPDVYMYGNYDLYQDDSLASDLKPDWFVGVGVNIPLVDNSGRSDKVRAGKSALSQVRYLKAQARQDLHVLVEKTYKEAEQALDEVSGLKTSLALARENLKLRRKAFSQGMNTSLDVIDAQLFLASIETQQAVASFEYLMSLNKLLALTSQMDGFAHYEQTSIPVTAFQAIRSPQLR